MILDPPEAPLTTFTKDRRRRRKVTAFYAGKVDLGFDKASAADLRKLLTPLIRKTQPSTKRFAHKGIWAEAELLSPKSSIGRSRLKARCGTPSSKACGRTCNEVVRSARTAIGSVRPIRTGPG